MQKRVYVAAGLAAVLLASAIGIARQGTGGAADVEWPAYGGDRGSTKYAPLDQINKDNVAQLRIAWRRPAVDGSSVEKKPDLSVPRDFRATPLMIGGVLYSPNGIGLVEAFHPGTGKTLWVQQPFPTNRSKASQATARAAWPTGATAPEADLRHPRRISDRARLRTPASRSPIGETAGGVNLKTGLGPLAPPYVWTGGPQVCRDVVIVGGGIDRRGPPMTGTAARRRAGVRRAHRQAALDVSMSIPRRAKSAARPGKTTPGRTPATRICGR